MITRIHLIPSLQPIAFCLLTVLMSNHARAQDLTVLDIGNPPDPTPPSQVTIADGAVTVTAGGSDIWDTHDGFSFVYTPVTGDFDVSVRVSRLDDSGHQWAKAGLMARENLTPGSRNVKVNVNPASRANEYEAHQRMVQDGATTDIRTSTAAPTFPNAWMRLQRSGNVFTVYRGTDGITWIQMGQTTAVYPSTLFLGLCTSADQVGDVNAVTTAQYRDYSLVPIPDDTPPTMVGAVGSQTLQDVTVTFSESVNQADALTLSNYEIRDSGGTLLPVVNAVLSGSDTVFLTTAAQQAGTRYVITVSNIKDRSANGNTIAPNSQVAFTAWVLAQGFVRREFYHQIPGASLSQLTSHPKYPNKPDVVDFASRLEGPLHFADN